MQQKTLSLLQFQKKFGTEKACQKQLFRLRWPEGFKCPHCGHAKAYFHSTRQLYQCQSCGYQASLTAGTVFHKTRTPLTKWFWMIWLMRQKSGISMKSLQRMLEIKTYKTVWTMGHKIRKALADRDANYKLAGLIRMDDTYFGAPKPGKRGRGAAGKAKVVVAVETPTNKPRFAAMRMVPQVSCKEIQPLVRERVATEAVIKTNAARSSWILLPVSGTSGWYLVREGGPEGPPLGSYFDRQYQRQYSWRPSWRQPQAPAPLSGRILLPFQLLLLGTANVQPHASCLLKYLEHYICGAKAISVY